MVRASTFSTSSAHVLVQSWGHTDGAVSTASYDARGFSPGPNESIVIEGAGPGQYEVLVHSYEGSGPYTLNIALE